MTGGERDPDPHDVPGFDRAIGIDDPVPDAEYGDQEVRPERSAADGGNPPVDDLHGALLKAKHELQQLEQHVPIVLDISGYVDGNNAVIVTATCDLKYHTFDGNWQKIHHD